MKKTSSEDLFDWSEKIKDQKLSDKSVRLWCAEQNISIHTFQYWKRKTNLACSENPAENPFLEIPEDNFVVEVSIPGVKLAISKDFDRTALANFLTLLR